MAKSSKQQARQRSIAAPSNLRTFDQCARKSRADARQRCLLFDDQSFFHSPLLACMFLVPGRSAFRVWVEQGTTKDESFGLVGDSGVYERDNCAATGIVAGVPAR